MVPPGVGQPPAGELETGIGAQVIEIVRILITAGDGKHAGAQNVGQRMYHPRRVAQIGDPGGKPLGKAEPPLGQGEQHRAAVRCEASAIERSRDLLASDGWQSERQDRIVVHGGGGALRLFDQDGLNTQSVRAISSLRYARQRHAAPS